MSIADHIYSFDCSFPKISHKMGNKMIHPDSSSVASKDSLMDGAPNHVFNLSNDIESEIDANLVLDLDGTDIPSPTRTIVSDIATVPSSFEDFYNNDVNIRTIDKSRYILGASIGVVEG